MTKRHSRLIQTLLLPTLSMAALACASAGQASTASLSADPGPARSEVKTGSAPTQQVANAGQTGDAAPAALTRETTPDRTRREEVPDHVREVRAQMEEAYQTGLDSYRAGRSDEAKEYFDRAVDIVLSSDIDLSEQPALKKAFDEMVRDIADMDAELYSRESGPEDAENASPLDEIKDITTYLPPDEAEKERQKIQQVARQISYDIPIALNPHVLAFVEAFQTRLRAEFEAGLQRSGAYLGLIKEIFRKEGLPEDLAYMAHQESAFKLNAYSRARAKGMWQFMAFTGRKYGLKSDLWVDERCDFEKATRAAALYLKDLHERYNDWYLAMAAYNAGEGKIDRAVARARTRDYWSLTKTKFIRRETKGYVPAILASILIDKSPEDYGFTVDQADPLKWDSIDLDKPTDLQVVAEATGATLETIRALNPELRGLVTPLNVPSYTLRIPDGTRHDLLSKLESLPDDKRVSWMNHEVRPGETFASIAHRYHVPVRALQDANTRFAGKRLRRGNVLNVPASAGMPAPPAVSVADDRPTYEPGERVLHRVRNGETLQRIAAKYRTTVANLKRWNGLDNHVLRAGQKLVAYYGEKGDGPRADAEGPSSPVSVAGGRIEYRVQRGDTLASIARKFSAAMTDLCRWNNLLPDSVLRPGDRIFVGEVPPGARSETGSAPANQGRTRAVRHRVKRGETLQRIALLYDVSVGEVRQWNRIGGAGRIYAGQVLTIRVD
ncbi:MAG TPA: LysM peptidoglycan-binding domain-containing protein [Candidatus Polarisedimenticolia bacterium]